MKTLQEFLRERTLPQGRYFLTHTEILEVAKEWLTQNRDNSIYSRRVIDELLEKISVPAKDTEEKKTQ
jgi:hypothetical protein